MISKDKGLRNRIKKVGLSVFLISILVLSSTYTVVGIFNQKVFAQSNTDNNTSNDNNISNNNNNNDTVPDTQSTLKRTAGTPGTEPGPSLSGTIDLKALPPPPKTKGGEG